MAKQFKAMVLSCIDPRFQPLVQQYLKRRKLSGQYSAFTIAGAAIGVTAKKFHQWHKTFIDNLATSIKLHKIKKLIAINHQDCGAAKIAVNKKKLNQTEEFKIHHMAFKSLKKKLKKIFPKLRLETLVIDLRGRIKNLKV